MSSSDVDIKKIIQNAHASSNFDKRRRIKDKVTNGLIALGGVFVLMAITAIFFYLLSVAWPLFFHKNAQQEHSYAQWAPSTQHTVQPLVQLEESNFVGMRLLPSGEVNFFKVADGSVFQTLSLPIPEGKSIVAIKRGGIVQGHIGVGLSDGTIIVVKPEMMTEGLGENKTATVGLAYPFGETPQIINRTGEPLTIFDVQESEGELRVLSASGSRINYATFIDGTASDGGGLSLSGSAFNFAATEEKTYSLDIRQTLVVNAQHIKDVQIGQGARWLYVVDGTGSVEVLRNVNNTLTLNETVTITDADNITTVDMLQGDISLIVGDKTGNISQWFMVRHKENGKDAYHLTNIRNFNLADAPITTLSAEQSRKGIIAGDAKGNVGYFYTTSDKVIDKLKTDSQAIGSVYLSSHGDGLLVSGETGTSFWKLDAHHPELSMSALWGKVWYESYPKPDYVWQSTSGNVDFESKMSLMPLTFGTLKAAFWAMLLSAPLAIAGAMYTAVFMSPVLRTKVKPTLELMEALPTVILGFLAGLWLAPIVYDYLPSIFSLLVVVPLIILLTGFAWMQLPLEKRNAMPEGIVPALLILPILIGGAIAFFATDMIEHITFANYQGSMVVYMKEKLGIDYQNQNALIVGLMMGFAVIPTIFSIAEDALFAVPRHLTNGSLALGATPWQTMVRVVLPTASPGIFSAVMIGFGRAVGETMIVLMATGNTPIMDFSLFNGMRTLSANVAVEMGEAEVGSTHYRILFLSALVLFVLTFMLNTAAELVRSRLRKKYGSM